MSIPLRSLDVSEWLPFGFGFAAGAMVFLVLTEFIPEALESDEGLRRNGYPELVAGLLVGVAVMVPLAMIRSRASAVGAFGRSRPASRSTRAGSFRITPLRR